MASSSSSSSRDSIIRTAAAVGGVAALGFTAWKLTRVLRARKLAAAAKEVKAASSTVAELEGKFGALVEDFLVYTNKRFPMPPATITRIREMILYNCLGGKYFRGLLVLDTTKTLSAARGLDYSKLEARAVALGWAIEVMQAYFLVADDIMDHSNTRRGKPCWYKREDVQMDAINDSYILASFMRWLIISHITDPVEQNAVMNLFTDVSYQTELGQLLDLSNQPQGRKGPELLAKFNEDVYTRIIFNKTAIYTFFLPIAAGMRLVGANTEEEMSSARAISTQIGLKFQIQDDWLDAFGVDIGKDGTDIQDHKCTWLIMQALKIMNAEQRAIIDANYGKTDAESVGRVKKLYLELGLEAVYAKQEADSYAAIEKMIETSLLPAAVYLPILKKVHGRKK